MAPFILKFKGNKSFVAFHNMNDGDSLTKTWKVCTKVASHLEQGQRLENLSWRLWHLHNIMVESDNAKSKREFKKLSRHMGDKLDKEKGKNIEELRAPGYKRTQSSDKMRRRAEEIERLREGAAHSGGIRRMQFTFSLDNPTPNSSQTATGTTTTTTATSTTSTTSAVTATTTTNTTATAPSTISTISTSTISTPTVTVNGAKPKLAPSSNFGKKHLLTFKEPALKVNANVTSTKGSNAPAQNRRRASVQSPDGGDGSHGSFVDQDQAMTEATSANENSGQSTASNNNNNNYVSSSSSSSSHYHHHQASVRLPSIFSSDFGPTALLYPAPTLVPSQTYGEDVPMTYLNEASPNSGLGISRPTIELPLDELLDVEGDSPGPWEQVLASIDASQAAEEEASSSLDDQTMKEHSVPDDNTSINDSHDATTTTSALLPSKQEPVEKTVFDSSFEMAKWIEAENSRLAVAAANKAIEAQKQAEAEAVAAAEAAAAVVAQQQQASSYVSSSYSSRRSSTSSRQRQSSVSSNTNQTQATTLNPMALMNNSPTSNGIGSPSGPTSTSSRPGNAPGATVVPISTPAGTKTECSNCGATHTPLWRRGLNDELNCNACGLYCKLHKRPRPKTMRSQTGEGGGRGGHHSHSRSVDTETTGGATAKCFNCHTTATPLWRKDDEGKTVCNACGLYYKLHGTNRPLSMKSDVVRKRSRHELKRAGLVRSSSEIPSASPGTSRRPSPVRVPSPQPAAAAEDDEQSMQEEQKTPQFSYDYTSSSSSRTDYGTKESSNASDTMLSSTISQDPEVHNNNHNISTTGSSSNSSGNSNGGSNGNSNKHNSNNGTTSSNYPYFPGPYHPDYLYQYASSVSDLPPIQTSPNGESSAYSIEGNKRRRLSSASHESSSPPTDPPPSATSFNSSNRSPGASPTFSVYSLPFSSIYSSYDGYDNMPWEKLHPPMALPDDVSPGFHPPMVLSPESSHSYIHPPMLPNEDVTMSSYIHPPMLPQAHSPMTRYAHPPMLPNHWNRDDPNNMFDSSANSNDVANTIVEMFESMMQPMD